VFGKGIAVGSFRDFDVVEDFSMKGRIPLRRQGRHHRGVRMLGDFEGQRRLAGS
jgi:hypothetical protein